MEREELDENGQPVPGTAQIVKPIAVYRNQGTPVPPIPSETSTKDEQSAYLAWAMQNQGDVLQPLFYTAYKGDTWTKPGAQITPAEAFNPANYLTGDIPSWATPEQKEAIRKARQEEYKRKQDEKKANRPAPTPRGPSRGTGMPPELEGMPRGLYFAPAPPRPTPRPPYPPAGAYPGRGIPPPELMDEGLIPGGPGFGGAPTPMGLPQPDVDYPGKEFSPSDPKWKGKVIECWVHDTDVKPEKTYRYHARYKIKNPVWTAANACSDPKLADKFALTSEWGPWSSPVSIPPMVNFFVLNSPMGGATTCKFEVFKWENGDPKSATFSVGFGDQVGGTKDGVDFTTHWTLVDFRDDPRADKQILLINDEGKLMTRSFRADQTDPLYKGLKEQIANLKAVGAAAAAGGAAPLVR
jgi:hypothetical protein